MIPAIGMSPFSRHIWLTLAIYLALVTMFVIYANAEKKIDSANELRFQSYLLADELRHSSNDLTRMARAYAATGKPIYKQHYQEILDIRNGKQSRPVNYENIYWDLVALDDARPRPSSGKSVSLLEMMRHAGFTDAEFAKLVRAQANSDLLSKTEYAAMELVEADIQQHKTLHTEALQLLQSPQYYQAKADIMRPLSEFQEMTTQRTLASMQHAKTIAAILRVIFICFSLVLLYMLWRTYQTLYKTLGGSVNSLYAHLTNIGNGDFDTVIPIAPGTENSVIGWLSVTQNKLNQLDHEHRIAKEKLLQLNKLYAALSQCNQAIVRCTGQDELFPQVCRAAVQFGGMKMAWIGLVNDANQQVINIASDGDGIDYLDNIIISTDHNDPYGNGPVGTAIRADKPFWCQDFQHDPSTAPWRELGARFGWRSAAALPLHRNGKVIGIFTAYSDQIQAFDEAAQNLLTEMAMDIDYALDNFERAAAEHHAQRMEAERSFMLERITSDKPLTVILNEIANRLDKVKPGNLCSILLLDEDGQHLHLGAAPSLPDFYNTLISQEKIGPGFGSCGNAAFTGKRTIVEDIAHHPYWEKYKSLAEKAEIGRAHV